MKKREFAWLTNRYIAVLVLVGILAVSSDLILRQQISAQESSAALINLAGRQRMLSQQSGLLAYRFLRAEAAEKDMLAQKLRDSISLLEQSHQALISGDHDLGLPPTLSRDLHGLYFGPTDHVDQKIRAHISQTLNLIGDFDLALEEQSEITSQIYGNLDSLVASIDRVVSQYQLESEAGTAKELSLMLTVTIFSLTVLFLCGLLIFRPIVTRLRQENDQRLAVEKILRHTNKLQSLGKLTGGIAHDFNNLLGVILGNLEMAHGNLDAQHASLPYLDQASQAVQRGATLTQRLLAFSRKQILDPQPIDLNSMICNMDELFRRTLRENIGIETVCAGGLWLTVADKSQLENALLNLVINARDAMSGAGKLTIETANSRLDDQYCESHPEVEPGQYVMLAISDSGTGMSEEVLEQVFEPFFTTKAVGEGSGLGLSMVFGFAKQSGGTCNVYSEQGHGTTVKIFLPRYRGNLPNEEATAEDVSPGGSGETVLLVEDDAALRNVCIEQLERLGYNVLSAENGHTAMDVLANNVAIDLLLTDVILPGEIGGHEIAQEALTKKQGIRVLYMSGYTENAIVHHGILDDDKLLLKKPFDEGELARKLRIALDATDKT